jgi:hypothetical protein
MTAQEAEGLKIGDRVQLGARIGFVEFVVSDVFVIKRDVSRDSDAYTREAFVKQFVPYDPKGGVMTAATAARGDFSHSAIAFRPAAVMTQSEWSAISVAAPSTAPE